MYKRNYYLNKIAPFQNTPLIKVITGMRRVGKTVFLQQLREQISLQDPKASCVYINKEDFEFDHIKTASDLNGYVISAFGNTSKKKYLFIDEVQEIEQWEKSVISFLSKGDIDIYITGSNAHLLSSELSTLLSGRFVSFHMYPLSFDEFKQFRSSDSSSDIFQEYLQFGGLPVLHHMEFSKEIINPYLNSLWSTILLKDIVGRYGVRNVDLLQRIAHFTFDSIGHTLSAKKIADYLKSQRLQVGVETVQNYLHYLASTFVLYKVPRYDLKGKRVLEIHEKYFLGDIGLRHAVIGFREGDISGILENIVFLELKKRGYRVFIGKIGEREVNFIAEKESKKIYIQVSYLLESPKTVEREIKPLQEIKDSYPKWLVSMDQYFGGDLEGIVRWNLVDFLLSKKF